MLAQSLYEQGIKLAETDAKGALKAFRQSYEIQPDFHVLYNIGKVCSKLFDTPCAIKAYEQYLKDGAAEVPAKKKKEVETELKTLAKAAGTTITIKTSVKGADVQIDGASVGKTPLDKPLIVKEGSHKVVLVQGNTPVEKTVKVALGTNENVELEPAKKEEPVAPAPAPAPPPPAPVGEARSTSASTGARRDEVALVPDRSLGGDRRARRRDRRDRRADRRRARGLQRHARGVSDHA
jgi:hypothetical protein